MLKEIKDLDMGMFYNVSEKQLLTDRNNLIKESGIPSLIKNGFIKSPFLGIWFGEYDSNIKGFSYELCRLNNHFLEIIDFSVLKGEPWIKIDLNIFGLEPLPNQIEELTGKDGINFHLPPNSITKMRLRSADDYKGPPLFYMMFLPEHKILSYYTKSGYKAKLSMLKKLIKLDMENIDDFVKRWHELHKPNITDWNGNIITKATN